MFASLSVRPFVDSSETFRIKTPWCLSGVGSVIRWCCLALQCSIIISNEETVTVVYFCTHWRMRVFITRMWPSNNHNTTRMSHFVQGPYLRTKYLDPTGSAMLKNWTNQINVQFWTNCCYLRHTDRMVKGVVMKLTCWWDKSRVMCDVTS